MPPKKGSQFSASFQLKLQEDLVDMIPNRARRNPQFRRDCFVGEALREHLTYLALPGGQCLPSVILTLHCCHSEDLRRFVFATHNVARCLGQMYAPNALRFSRRIAQARPGDGLPVGSDQLYLEGAFSGPLLCCRCSQMAKGYSRSRAVS